MNIPFCKSTVGQEEIDAVTKVMQSGWMAAGPETEAFEKEFAEYVGCKYAIYTNSGTSALKMAYKYFKEEKDMGFVYYPENTFCATYSAAYEMGLHPMPMKLDHQLFDPSKRGDYSWWGKRAFRENAPTSIKTTMHYGGIKDEDFCDIEDSAHRIEPNDPLVGKIRTYSFYVTKNMTTGSGGMFVTNDKEIYEKSRLYWKDGLSSSTHDRQTGKGYNYKVQAMAGGYDGNDIGAAIGRVQLAKLKGATKKRNAIVERYNTAFDQDWTGNHLYPYFVERLGLVDELIQYLNSHGIATGYHYPSCGWLGVSLPIFPDLMASEQEYIIDKVTKWCSKH